MNDGSRWIIRGPAGQVIERDAFLKDIATGDLSYDLRHAEAPQVWVDEQTAVVVATADMNRREARTIAITGRTVSLYACRNGRWMCVYARRI